MFFNQSTNNKQITNKNGFTLIEVLIALVIFSFGILGLANLQISSVGGNTSARMQTEATIQAMDRIETLMALSYDDANLDSASNPHTIVTDEYTIVWNVSDDTPISFTKTIQVTVTWSKRGDQTLNIDFIKMGI